MISRRTDEVGVLRVRPGDELGAMSHERLAASGQHDDFRAPVVGVLPSFEIAGLFDAIRDLTARLFADREFFRDRADGSTCFPDEREERPLTQAQ